MAGVRMSGDWLENVMASVSQWLDDDLGADIEADAVRYCPVDTGALRDSIEHHLNGNVLVVKATGSDERFYARWVETGHRVAHPSTGIVGPERVPAQPFLRPALYAVRRP
jgi:hypothetical protein